MKITATYVEGTLGLPLMMLSPEVRYLGPQYTRDGQGASWGTYPFSSLEVSVIQAQVPAAACLCVHV